MTHPRYYHYTSVHASLTDVFKAQLQLFLSSSAFRNSAITMVSYSKRGSAYNGTQKYAPASLLADLPHANIFHRGHSGDLPNK